MTPAEGAQTVVRYALLDDAGVSGHHFGPEGELPW
jgi:hypothetical protein